MIRDGQFRDIDQIYGLAYEAVFASGRHKQVDEEVLVATIKNALSAPNMAVFVSDNGERLNGLIAGMVTPSFHGRFLVATDIIFHHETGVGAQLFKRYLRWAKSFNDVKQIDFTQSSGEQGTSRMMGVFGFKQVGGHWVAEV